MAGADFVRAAAIIVICLVAGCSAASAQVCAALPISRCRETAPDGGLLHERNSRGARVWTVSCKGPDAPPAWSNSQRPRLDGICRAISACPAAGGFGRFLQAVTFDCMAKRFDGYFGLDGMTFGILDWTSDNLPATLKAYQDRDAGKFAQLFGPLGLPMKDGCLDPKWTCAANKRAKLTCDAKFHDAFSKSLRTASFQKAQVDLALAQYEKRLTRFSRLGLKTEYGNTALAVVANNLVDTPTCKPEAWKAACRAQPTEAKLVDCMLEQYAQNSCRGSPHGSQERKRAIQQVFAGRPSGDTIHPNAASITACTDLWGGGS